MADAPLLSLRGVSKSFGGIRAVHDISFEVRAGESVGLVGPNGAGKSTLLRAISGLILPDRGSVHLYGKDITGVSPFRLARQGLAHVVEGRGIFPDLTVAEQLRLGQLHTRANRRADSGTGAGDSGAPLFDRDGFHRSYRDGDHHAAIHLSAM